MVGVSTGDGLVVGRGGRVASIARAHRRHAVERLEHGFDAPEATGAQDDDFLAFGGWIILSVGKGPGIDRQAHASVSSHTGMDTLNRSICELTSPPSARSPEVLIRASMILGLRV